MKLDRVLSSAIPLPEALPYSSLSDLVFHGPEPEGDEPILIGCLEDRVVSVGLAQLRGAVRRIAYRLGALGHEPGETICLARLPGTSELPVAITYAALSAAGYRVLLPMYLERERFGTWLKATEASAVLWDTAELALRRGAEADQALHADLAALCAEQDVPTLCLSRDLEVLEAASRAPAHDEPSLAPRGSHDDECLVLTTSGTSGQQKLVRYRSSALLWSCASWEAAGLFEPQRLGGRALSFLLPHSMGVRGFWNALWTGKALCLITPEWVTEKPERVREALLLMRPEHITGGPALFEALLELARVFPDLKQRCIRDLRCAISTGAPFDAGLAQRVRAALGLTPRNAFGATETMQLTSTLLGSSIAAPTWLGEPLPGVRLGLEQAPDQPPGTYLLHASAPHASAGYLGAADRDDDEAWFCTGDLVRLERSAEGEQLHHVGRAVHDFVKDGFGIKVPLSRVADFYRDLGYDAVEHLELFPLEDEPGLGALVFGADGPGALERLRGLFEARHEELRDRLEELELRHFTIGRFALVAGAAPRTAKGTVDRAAIIQSHRELVGALTQRFAHQPGIMRVNKERLARSSAIRLTSPRRGELMRLARLDVEYTRAQGDRLYFAERGQEIEVVDFVGGFGANLLGHNHPEILAAATRFLASGAPPIADQGSARKHEGELARKLAQQVNRAAGTEVVVRFASTGAEVVEMALLHALLEREERWRRHRAELRRQFGASHAELVAEIIAHDEALLATEVPKVLTVERAFHGLTSVARRVTQNAKLRAAAASLVRLEAVAVPHQDTERLAELVAREQLELRTLRRRAAGDVEESVLPSSRFIASLVEPVLGEGGVTEVEPAFLDALSRLPFPLIVDEIQCGLGRTGDFLASAGARAHYFLFSKSLGGGLAKISALLVDRARYVPRFEELHASTFAGDAFSCAVAGRVLEVLERDDVPARARERGERLRRLLEELRAKYPEILRSVRGRGLLLAVELDPAAVRDALLLRAVADRELLGVLVSAYLLRRHRVRVLPSLSAPLALRVQPSAYVDDAALEQLGRALAALCEALRAGDAGALLSYLCEEDEAFAEASVESALASRPAAPHAPWVFSQRLEPAAAQATKVAFVNHFVHPERELAMISPILARLSENGRRALFHRLMALMEMRPFAAFSKNLFGGRVHFTSIMLSADVATLEALHRSRSHRLETERVQDAVDLAAAQGCTVVALGGYTSILTADGTGIHPPPGVLVTSGNSFTVALGARRLTRACSEAGIDPRHAGTTLAVVGATGNIGRALSHRLVGAEAFQRVLLVGRDLVRLEALRSELLSRSPSAYVSVAGSVDALRDARPNVIAVATNASAPLIFPHHLDEGGAAVIVDLSVPSSVSPEVDRLPGVKRVPLSGTVAVPGEPDFQLSSHTEPGTAFACAAEAMLLGLERGGATGLHLVGAIEPDAVEQLERWGDRHGFFARLGEGGFKLGAST